MKADTEKNQCKCSMTIRILGDGCYICNPELWKEMLAQQEEDEAKNE